RLDCEAIAEAILEFELLQQLTRAVNPHRARFDLLLAFERQEPVPAEGEVAMVRLGRSCGKQTYREHCRWCDGESKGASCVVHVVPFLQSGIWPSSRPMVKLTATRQIRSIGCGKNQREFSNAPYS